MRPHAALAAGEWNSCSCDANGNMLTRTENGLTYTQTWDAENRLKTISGNGHTVTYTYDADGQRVKKVEDGQTTVYVGNSYEKNVTTNTVTTYYAGSQRIAQRQGGVVSYLVGDNLGSTSLTTNDSGAKLGRQKYYPYGAPRFQSGTLKTDFRFTGQRSEEAKFGSVYDYGARFYSPSHQRPTSGASSVRPHAALTAGEWNSCSYDANGNMLTRTENGLTYTHMWDAENRLKTITGNGHTVTYTYDADGQRVRKVEDDQTTILGVGGDLKPEAD